MKCNCLKEVEGKLKKVTGDPEAKIETSLIINEEKNRLETRIPIIVSYRQKKKDGELKQKPERSHITAGYCPFCGEKVN